MERFWSKVDRTGDCWLWTGARWRNGYGMLGFTEAGKWKLRGAHRVSWEIHFGPIPEGLLICHRCDQPACVRPDHLFLGTDADNSADMVSKKRFRSTPRKLPTGADHWTHQHPDRVARGAKAGPAKLSDASVREIRALHKKGITVKALALRYGMGQTAIYSLLAGRSWSSVI